jgi:hypothetical protein
VELVAKKEELRNSEKRWRISLEISHGRKLLPSLDWEDTGEVGVIKIQEPVHQWVSQATTD